MDGRVKPDHDDGEVVIERPGAHEAPAFFVQAASASPCCASAKSRTDFSRASMS